ncbi:recombinase family protein [Priestia megaterium]|uniref:recombinase family protein n=1 Tax=Priestia megaterium TaxID=1404 RepID=UPI002877FE06|nr:recombinase family protein [Priestia megaterium]
MKRVWCLYRVSSKKQLHMDDDIPMQKNACHDYVTNKEGWEITRELSEKGISGWKVKAEERDALNIIKKGALNGEFDILLVFMLDRIGRKEDETPLVVNFLNSNGVEVWSTNEGQRKTDTHIDKLLNYISFWQADGESQKTSKRVREAKKQLSEQGYFQGGPIPIGYKIVETNQNHWKNKDRKIKELVPDEVEAGTIETIFHLYVNKHMGYRRIADYLNEKGYRNKNGKLYGISTIQRILSNPIYTGWKRYKGFNGKTGDTQPYNPKLRIISDELFKEAEDIRNKKREKIREQDKAGIPLAGKLMFSGLAYCSYCGAKLSGNYLYRKKQSKDKPQYVNYRYRCPLNKGQLNGEHQKSMWGAKKYDRFAIERIKHVISNLDLESIIDNSTMIKEASTKVKERNVNNIEKELKVRQERLAKLHAEISKAINNESEFTPKQLSSAITNAENDIEQLKKNLNNLKEEIASERENFSEINSIVNVLNNWEHKFDNADDDSKKAMLSKIINKVYFSREGIEIEFNLMLEGILRIQLIK